MTEDAVTWVELQGYNTSSLQKHLVCSTGNLNKFILYFFLGWIFDLIPLAEWLLGYSKKSKFQAIVMKFSFMTKQGQGLRFVLTISCFLDAWLLSPPGSRECLRVCVFLRPRLHGSGQIFARTKTYTVPPCVYMEPVELDEFLNG